MSTLDRTLRKKLADTIIAARLVAEEAATDAVRRLGIIEDEAPGYLTADQKALRVRLRAHARTLGDEWNGEKKKLHTTKQLEAEASYEIWHRMLFGRFLVERGLLVHPDLGVPIAASELTDLAQESGEADPWALVEQFAAPSLPGVFKPGDPVLAMTLDPALTKRLRDLVAGLPAQVFTADDSLGWTYQFWRTVEKDAVNKSGCKIGAAELPAVTQLFTERYIVRFLLHNTFGAWWAGKLFALKPALAREAQDEQALRDACAIPGVSWEYLRFVRDGEGAPWRPASGTFPGWPSRAAEITYCDPCCGSGHFLVEAFAILTALRQFEDGLLNEEAARAVLQENLHGLEIDGRCVQIATFNIALAAWSKAGRPIALPQPHIAWIGASSSLSRLEFSALGGTDLALSRTLERLHDQFALAPMLGSLLEIGGRDLLDADLCIHGKSALSKLRETEPERIEDAIAARGLLDGAELLARNYTLLATNVPFLGRGKQGVDLATFIAAHMREAKGDLATAMLARMLKMASPHGTVAVVTPQNWLFLGGYRSLRERILACESLRLVAVLGEHGFESNAAAGAFTALAVVQRSAPVPSGTFCAFEASAAANPAAKAAVLQHSEPRIQGQSDQKANPQSTISTDEAFKSVLLRSYATAIAGVNCGDEPHYGRLFWEVERLGSIWEYQVSAPTHTTEYSGFSYILLWEGNAGRLRREVEEKLGTTGANAWLRGTAGWGKRGITASLMRDLPVTLFTGALWDGNTGVIVPKNQKHLPAIWAFCSSPVFAESVRKMNKKMSTTLNALVDVPFELEQWQEVATGRFPNGLPQPYSDCPTQWLFHGHPAFAQDGTELHVALARVCGYRWPAETDSNLRLSDLGRQRVTLASNLSRPDPDPAVLLHATGSKLSLADRLRVMLSAAYGIPLSPTKEADLIKAADAKFDKREIKDHTIESWLQNRAFRQHCVLFESRPFLWQIWDGLSDGFSAFLYYHRLDYAALERLSYTLLGDWIANARAQDRSAHESRALQLQQRLRAILDGQKPYDIFVRWKPTSQQPIGWHPDLDDGVRLNLRPFFEARVLREQPRINWNKDRGVDVTSAPWYHLGPTYGGNEGDRINDHHLTLAEKRAARGLAA